MRKAFPGSPRASAAEVVSVSLDAGTQNRTWTATPGPALRPLVIQNRSASAILYAKINEADVTTALSETNNHFRIKPGEWAEVTLGGRLNVHTLTIKMSDGGISYAIRGWELN